MPPILPNGATPSVTGGGFFSGLSDSFLETLEAGRDFYLAKEAAKFQAGNGSLESVADKPTVSDRDPDYGSQTERVVFAGFTQQQLLIGFGGLLAGALILKALD